MTKTERTRQIKLILKAFDFAKVHKAMQAVQWTWGDGVPTVERLKGRAEHLLLELDVASSSLSTGGFKAYWAEPGYLGLRFEMESREIDYEDDTCCA